MASNTLVPPALTPEQVDREFNLLVNTKLQTKQRVFEMYDWVVRGVASLQGKQPPPREAVVHLFQRFMAIVENNTVTGGSALADDVFGGTPPNIKHPIAPYSSSPTAPLAPPFQEQQQQQMPAPGGIEAADNTSHQPSSPMATTPTTATRTIPPNPFDPMGNVTSILDNTPSKSGKIKYRKREHTPEDEETNKKPKPQVKEPDFDVTDFALEADMVIGLK